MHKTLYFNYLPSSAQWVDLYQICFRGSSRGRNQLCGILLQLAHGFRFCEGSKFATSHWLGRSPLIQCWRYRAACDFCVYISYYFSQGIFNMQTWGVAAPGLPRSPPCQSSWPTVPLENSDSNLCVQWNVLSKELTNWQICVDSLVPLIQRVPFGSTTTR